MSAISSPSPAVSRAAPSVAPAGPAEIDASCRAPVLFLFASAAVWLVIASAFALIASLKFHAPGFMAGCPCFTYGRVQPAQMNALIYGFIAQAALGVALWLVARLGRTPLALQGIIGSGAVFWNAGVTLGLFGILIGDGTGHEWLEMPGYASPVLFIAYSMIGVPALLTFHHRRERSLYVSQWFLLVALFWFPWIYSTANLLLVFFPVRGVLQAVVDWWYIGNLTSIGFGFIGLATIFYFLPKLAERPLHSRYLAILAFWTLALFGGWGGIHSGAPVPAWMPGISTVFSVLGVVPLLAIAINFRKTFAGASAKMNDSLPLRFIVFGAAAYLVAGLVAIVTAFPKVSLVTHFTFFAPARTQLFLYGFLGMTAFGAIHHIVPRVMQKDWPSAKLGDWQFRLAASGLTLYAASLTLGGLLQGWGLGDPTVPFTTALHRGLVMFRMSTLGDLAMAAGNGALALNLGWLLIRCCRECCVPVVKSALKPQWVEVVR